MLFLNDPVKLRVIDIKTGRWIKSYIFIGSVPDDVKEELISIEENKKYNKKIINDYFGSEWLDNIGLTVKGGEEIDLEGMLDESIMDEIGDIDLDMIVSNEEKIKVKIEKNKDFEFVFDFNAYPIDDIFKFKQKIFAIADIPVYRQHLWFKTNITHPASYNFIIGHHTEYVNAEKIIAYYKGDIKSDVIENIPVEMMYYKNRESIKILANDTFNLLENIYTKYGTNEYYVFDLESVFENKDITKQELDIIYYGFIMVYFPMITYQFFTDMVKNESELELIFPDIAFNKKQLYKKLVMEDRILLNTYDKMNNKEIMNNLFSSITETVISNDIIIQDIENLLSLRNIFDMLELDKNMCYAKLNILYENKNVVIKKSYLNEKEAKDIIPLNSLLIKIKLNEETNENLRFVIYKNGNYNIFTNWREENHMDFEIIKKISIEKINPLIKMINKWGMKVKYYDYEIVELSKKNIKFTETSMTYYYDDDILESKFNVVKNILNDYKNIGIITPKENIGGYEYFFNKGMYNFDVTRIEKNINVNNYYEYLTSTAIKQKWETIFLNTRLFEVINVLSKLKFKISGIRDDVELFNFNILLMGFLNTYVENTKHMKLNSTSQKSEKKLKNLKLQDPILYDFKKIYNSNIVYSKICQKPYQPLLLSDAEYGTLSNDKKKNAVKYWNFTTQKPVWYSCPNSKFPYIKFIIKQHPKDYCIPCCKKMAMGENINIEKQKIHSECLTKHLYKGEKFNVTKTSTYIANYGKNIEFGRISRLPENTLEPLLFDIYSLEGSIDQECTNVDGYYILGIEQNIPTINNIGILHCICNSLNLNVDEFILQAIHKIKKDNDKFRILLNGNINLYFSGVKDLVETLSTLNSNTLVKQDIPWNDLFANISFYYFGISIVLFIDKSKEMIELILPTGLKTPDEMFPETHKFLLIIKFKLNYYPIYLFNTELFKKTGAINTKLFNSDSGAINILKSVVNKTFLGNNEQKVNLNTIKKFAQNNKLKITKYYINYANLCYGVSINYEKEIYIPIEESYYTIEKDIELKFELATDFPEYEKLWELIEMYNKWAMTNENNIYPIIKPKIYLKHDGKYIGFIFSNINFYFKPVKSIEKVKTTKILYDPARVNKMLDNIKNNKTKDGFKYSQKTDYALYEYYSYNIILLHIISIFNNDRNKKLRDKLYKTIKETNFNKDIMDMKNLLDDMCEDDKKKINKQISNYMNIHHNKELLIDSIDKSYFEFDRTILHDLVKLSHEEILDYLYKLSEKFTVIGKPKDISFPNIYNECDKSKSYCDGNKLIIEKDKLDIILELLAADIKNPNKIKWLFNSSFIDTNIEFFKFIKRKYEVISIEFI